MNRRESKAPAQGGSVTVVLPADWVRGNHIKPGDTLLVENADTVTIRHRNLPRRAP